MGILFFGAKNQQKYFTARTQNENSNNKKRRRNKVGNSYNVSFWIEGMEKLLPTI